MLVYPMHSMNSVMTLIMTYGIDRPEAVNKYYEQLDHWLLKMKNKIRQKYHLENYFHYPNRETTS